MPIDPFIRIPPDADAATIAAIKAQAAREGREAVPEIPPTPAELALAAWTAATPTCATDRQTFLQNLDDIAAAKVRPVGKAP